MNQPLTGPLDTLPQDMQEALANAGATPIRTCVPEVQRRPQYAVSSGFEVARMVEIGNEPWLSWAPSQPFLR